jgi:dTDP-4-dehydrorhamnose reductase
LILKKIVITGGEGRFAQILKQDSKLDILYPGKKELNVLDINSINKYLKKNKPKYLIHAAALSRPMSIHEKQI